MCVMSVVMQEWDKIVPQPSWPYPNTQPWPNTSPPTTTPPWNPSSTPPIVTSPQVDMDNLQAILESFRLAQEAARIADEATGQEDCVDPDKAKLLERVEALENALKELKAAQNKPKTKRKKRKA